MNAADMEIGLCWGTLQHANLIELIEAAGRHGFPTLSIRPDMVLRCLDSGVTDLKRRLADAGTRVRVIDALTALPGLEAKAAAGAADAETCFRVAEATGCPIVNIAQFGAEPATPAMLIDAVGEAARLAGQRGLDIVLEFVPGTSMPDIHAARAIVEGCGAANCRILLDPWHLMRSGGSVEDVAAMPAGMIGAYQLDDRNPPEPGAPYVPMTGRELPGEGVWPLHDLTRAALRNNPALTAELEVFSEELRTLGTDAAAARAAAATALWREGFA